MRFRRTLQSRCVRSVRAEVIGTAIVGLAGVAGAALAARPALSLSAAYPPKAVFCFLVIAILAVRAIPSHHPFARFGIANHVTMFRAGLVALVAGAIGELPSAESATAVAAASLVAALLDSVDGWLARRTGLAGRFGARFDMEIDALLMLVLAILVWQHAKAGSWVLAAGMLRYVFVLAGWLAPWMRRPLPPSVRRKVACVVQIGALILAMLPVVTPRQGAQLAGAALAVLAYSFLADTAWLWRSDGRKQVA